MGSTYVVEAVGPPIPNLRNSDLCDLSLGLSGLRIAVALGKDDYGNDRVVEIVFTTPRGFRCSLRFAALIFTSTLAFKC
jgi:hypothetical protein